MAPLAPAPQRDANERQKPNMMGPILDSMKKRAMKKTWSANPSWFSRDPTGVATPAPPATLFEQPRYQLGYTPGPRKRRTLPTYPRSSGWTDT